MTTNSSTVAYRKLPGRSRAGFGLVSYEQQALHLASDHLMLVRNNYYSETWRRFYLKDIQAVVVCHTNVGRSLNVVLGGVTLLLFLLALVSTMGGGVAASAVFFVLALVTLVVLAGNLFAGPTCVTTLHTAVQAERLTSLSRTRAAEAALEILKPAILAAQGSIDQTHLNEPAPQETAPQTSAYYRPSGVSPAAGSAPSEPIRHEDGKYHEIMCWIMGGLAISAVIDAVWQNQIKNIFDSLLFLSFFVLIVVSLVKQHNSDLSGTIKSLPWISLGVSIVFFIVSNILGVVALIDDPEAIRRGAMNIKLESPAAKVFFLFEAVVYLFLSFWGLGLVKKFRDDYQEFLRQRGPSAPPGGPA